MGSQGRKEDVWNCCLLGVCRRASRCVCEEGRGGAHERLRRASFSTGEWGEGRGVEGWNGRGEGVCAHGRAVSVAVAKIVHYVVVVVSPPFVFVFSLASENRSMDMLTACSPCSFVISTHCIFENKKRSWILYCGWGGWGMGNKGIVVEPTLKISAGNDIRDDHQSAFLSAAVSFLPARVLAAYLPDW